MHETDYLSTTFNIHDELIEIVTQSQVGLIQSSRIHFEEKVNEHFDIYVNGFESETYLVRRQFV